RNAQGTTAVAKSDGGGAQVSRAHRSKKNERTERCSASAGQCVPPGGGPAYHSALADGIRGSSGIKARMNPRAFQYFSTIALGVLNYQIKRARLPNINQCIPQMSGCVQVYNLYVSRYRCPQRLTIYPAPPNLIVLDVQNLDIGVTGNLGGQIVILLPLALFGIIQVNAYQLNIRVGTYIERGPTGCPVIRVASCAASVGYVD
uniref:BPI1 domain-containing protein n=1 Tax=Globodera pallida TaxID=36090 RepID=A0A183CRR8_GLOPA